MRHCGHMPREQWRDGAPDEAHVVKRIGAGPMSVAYELDVCPGWLRCQPAVHEGAEAALALEHGALDRMFPGDEGPVEDAAQLVMRARNQYEAAQMEQARLDVEAANRG